MTRMAWHLVFVVGVLGLVEGCRERPPPPVPDAGVDGGAAAAATLPELQLAVRYEAPDGGMAPIPFASGARPVIDPTQTLDVGANLGLRNYRIRLFDEADRVLPSDDELLSSSPRLDYRIQLAAPLKTGHRYTLVIDAQTGSAFSDSAGRPQPDQRLEFQISGEKEKPSQKPTRTRKHHR